MIYCGFYSISVCAPMHVPDYSLESTQKVPHRYPSNVTLRKCLISSTISYQTQSCASTAAFMIGTVSTLMINL